MPSLPVSLSAKAEPVRFSKLLSVSLPPPPVAWAVVTARLTVTPAPAGAYDTVSVPVLPFSLLLPALPVITLFRLLPVPDRLALPVSVRFSRLAPSV